MIEVPTVVRNKALAAGARRWLDDLPSLVDALAREWGLAIGRVFNGAAERVSTGLIGVQAGLAPCITMLAVAERLVRLDRGL